MTRWRAAASIGVVIAGAFAALAVGHGRIGRWLAERGVAAAERKLAAGDDRGAEEELSVALERDPLHPRARRLRGELSLRRHDLGRAFLDLQAHADAFPDDADGWID